VTAGIHLTHDGWVRAIRRTSVASGEPPGQVVNEFDEMLAIEKARAKPRKEANLKEGDEQPRRGNTSTSGEEGKARDKAAEKVNANVSGRTLEKGLDAL